MDYILKIVPLVTIGVSIFKWWTYKIYLTDLEKALETNVSRANRTIIEYIGVILYWLAIIMSIIIIVIGLQSKDSDQNITNQKFSGKEISLILNDKDESKKLKNELLLLNSESKKIDYIQELEIKKEIISVFNEKKLTPKNIKEFNNVIITVKNNNNQTFGEFIYAVVVIIMSIFIFYYIYRDIRRIDYERGSYFLDGTDVCNRFYIIKSISNNMVMVKSDEGDRGLMSIEDLKGRIIYSETKNEVSEKRYTYYYNRLKKGNLLKKVFNIRVIRWMNSIALLGLIISVIVLYMYPKKEIFQFGLVFSVSILIPFSYLDFQSKKGESLIAGQLK